MASDNLSIKISPRLILRINCFSFWHVPTKAAWYDRDWETQRVCGKAIVR